MAARCARAHREDSARARGLHPGQFAAECLRCQFAPMAARSARAHQEDSARARGLHPWQVAPVAARCARAHQVTNARPRPSAWALNSRLWQLAPLVLIERIAHVRGGCTPGNSRRSASAVDSRLWQLATARAHREDSARARGLHPRRFAPMAARSARAHQEANSRARRRRVKFFAQLSRKKAGGALVPSGLRSALGLRCRVGRCWTSATGRQHPRRQPRLPDWAVRSSVVTAAFSCHPAPSVYRPLV